MASSSVKNPNTYLGGVNGEFVGEVMKTYGSNQPGGQPKKFKTWSWNGQSWDEIGPAEYQDKLSRQDQLKADFINRTQKGEFVTDDIRKKFAKYSPTLRAEEQSLRYPKDVSIHSKSDFVIFNFYDYKPPFHDKKSLATGASPYLKKNLKKLKTQTSTVTNLTLDAYNRTGNLQEYFDSPKYKQILLYMPDDVQDAFSAQWEGKAFGSAATGLLSAASSRGIQNKFFKTMQTAGENLSRSPANTAAALVTGLTNSITGDKISQSDVFGGISGVIRNPNVELLFQNMKVRTFDLTFKLAPYNVDEAKNIREIVQTFKRAMLPQYNVAEGTKVMGYEPYTENQDAGNQSLQAGFIQVPKLCHVAFMKGAEQHPYLPRYKMCAITDLNINYTPDGNYAAFADGHPVATEIKLSFMETKLIFSEDIGSGEGSASFEADREYAYGGM